MIVRKPYAFLVKHFKLIHLILTLLFLYLLLQTTKINGFFVNYVNAGYTTNELDIASNYLSPLIFVVIFFILLISILVYSLMKQKEKNTKLYLGIIIFYIVMLICVFITFFALNTIEDASLSTQTSRIFRDVSFAFYIPQIFFFIYAFLRGIGFDIKNFDFEMDLKEMDIDEFDSEEFEVTLGKNNYKYQRKFRRFLRELKYYFLENKIALSVVGGIALVILLGSMFMIYGVYHRSYNQKQRINHNGLTIKVVNSMLTNMTTNGQIISKDKYYLAVSLNISNSGTKAARLDYENFKVMENKQYIMPTLDRGSYFPDLGIAYTRNMEIASKSEGTYVLVYEVSNISAHYDLRILESLEQTIFGLSSKYKNVKLNYETIINKYDVRSYELGKIFDMSDTLLNVSQFQVRSYSIANNYEYKYKKCTSSNICQDYSRTVVVDPTKYGVSKKILALDVFFNLDQSSYYYQTRKSSSSFINDFVNVRAVKNGNSKEYTVNNITPNDLNGVWLLAVDNEIENADKLDLLVTIHGKNYVMNLK